MSRLKAVQWRVQSENLAQTCLILQVPIFIISAKKTQNNITEPFLEKEECDFLF